MLSEVLRICVTHISRTMKMAGAGLEYSYWDTGMAKKIPCSMKGVTEEDCWKRTVLGTIRLCKGGT